MRFGLYSWTQRNPVVRLKEGAAHIVQAFANMRAAWAGRPGTGRKGLREKEEVAAEGAARRGRREAVLGAAV
jgi:hypothetical protein